MKYLKSYPESIFILLIWFCSTCTQKIDKNGANGNIDSTQIQEMQIPDPIDFDLNQIIERGSIKALMDNTSATYFLYKGEPMGFEYELADRFAKFLGVDLEIEIVKDFQEILVKLNNGDGDIVCHNLTITRRIIPLQPDLEIYLTKSVVILLWRNKWGILIPNRLLKW